MSGRQYFLGIGGDQSGPYLEQDVINRIRQGAVPPDALVWFEGLPDWQPIQSIEFLQQAFSEAGADFTATSIEAPLAAPPSSRGGGFTPLDEDLGVSNQMSQKRGSGSSQFDAAAAQMDASTFTSGSAMSTVFSEKEATFGASGGGGKGKALALLGLAVMLVASGVGYLFTSGELKIPELLGGKEDLPPRQPQIQRLPAQDDRTTRLRKAMSELLIQPDTVVPVLQEIIKQNPKDAAGKEAADGLIEFYKNRRNPTDAARVLMQLGRPLEASQLFLSDPPSYREAEEAIFAAYKVSNDANKRDLLVQDIRLLLGQANNIPVAVERIRLLEKEFKGTKHPFGYYLNSVDSRIADIFNRISFHFVQKLLTFIEGEFPQMNLAKRPIIEVQRDKRGRYRVSGRYEGDIVLNQDKLDGIKIVFWHVGDQWSVVETNLTPERAKWASDEKDRLKDTSLSANEMLDYMEGVFRTQFPKTPIHETVSSPTSPSKNMQ